jgi:creatinine amidohydrolase
MTAWHWYHELRPDLLAEVVRTAPVAYWALGLLEHHGWHLPVGFDGIKAERMCMQVAERTGGVLLPTMWWGAGGGHGDFMWTFYQDEAAAEAIVVRTAIKLVEFGFRAIVLLAGHYPWDGILARQVPPLQAAHPEVLFLAGIETVVSHHKFSGDHAAREETSFGLYLLPELVDLGALTPGRDAMAWPHGRPPEVQHPAVCFDASQQQFAQMGVDARTATREHGEEVVSRMVADLADQINRHLGRSAG